ncbi:hypothetical protein ACS0TY_025741 [Phlomoides rotata]
MEESDAMKRMIMTLMEKFDAFSSSLPRETLPPLVQEQQGVQEVNFMGKQNFQGGNYHQSKPNFQSQPQGYNTTSNFQGGSSSYNPNFKHHENFSYANQNVTVQFPLGFNPGAKPPNNEGKPSQDEVMEVMFKKMEEFMKNTSGQIKTLEHQMGQLATTAIQLRSGTSYEGPRKPLEHDDNVSEKDEDEERTPSREDEEEKDMMKNEEEEEEELELVEENEEDKGMGIKRGRKRNKR